MGNSENSSMTKVSDVFKTKIIPSCKLILSFTSDVIIFLSRLVYALIANLIVMTVILSVFAFIFVILAAFCLLIMDFFFSNNEDTVKGREFIAYIGENIFSVLSAISLILGDILDGISTNYVCQGLIFFFGFIVLTNKLVNAGINSFIENAKIWINKSKSRIVWAFEPIGILQPKEDDEIDGEPGDFWVELVFNIFSIIMVITILGILSYYGLY